MEFDIFIQKRLPFFKWLKYSSVHVEDGNLCLINDY